ncbi:phospholipase A2 [Rhinatrema bivittatum]|uniref:phospholipase A2 n=1 Tax=Rhinatrema bivittatum TaxID=194408 RepID=UPI00112C2DDF|nr:phospholipase A2 [Rhinatrema bivittatum]
MFQLLVLILAVSPIAAVPPSRALWQFWNVLKCTIPDCKPIQQYNQYGCYCGVGGRGNPKDELDRCCQIHDHCYEAANQIENCSGLLEKPYINIYSYTCSGTSVTCKSDNTLCEMHICECDRQAAICFSNAPYNEENKNLDKNKFC